MPNLLRFAGFAPVVVAILGVSGLSYAQVAPVRVDLFGALGAEVTSLPSRVETVRERLVTVDRQLIEGARTRLASPGADAAVLRLNLFGDTVIDVVVDETGSTSTGWWIGGHLAGDNLTDVTFVVNGDIIMGTVRVLGATYEIRPAGDDAYAVRELDPAAPRPREAREGDTESDASWPSATRPPEPDGVQSIGPFSVSGNAPDNNPPLTEDGSRIDVLVVYTPAARNAQGGHDKIRTLIDLFVTETNRALAESGAIPRFNLVHVQQVDYTEQPLQSDDDESMIMAHLLNPSDGYMDDVHLVRDRYGADLVHLIASEVGFPYCGEAKRLQPSDSRAAERYAFGVTRHDCGGGVFAHELGHALGLNHDRYAERHACCIVRHGREWNKPHPYSYGYVNQRAFEPGAPESSRWLTIMSYESQYLDAGYDWGDFYGLLRFSNPTLTHEGDPTGIPGTEPSSAVTGPSDARRTLNELGHVVANFRPPANHSPEPAGTLVPLEIRADEAPVAVDVSGAFRDPDGDRLTYGAKSSVPAVASVSVTGSRMVVTPAAAGTTLVTVTATDLDGSNTTASQSFPVTVAPPANQPPEPMGALPPLKIDVNAAAVTVEVSGAFRDPDGDRLSYAASSSAPAVASASAVGSRVTVTPVSPGTSTVTVTATDTFGSNQTATQAFPVAVSLPFTDHVIVPGETPIRAVHITELRSRINALRSAAGLERFAWTDPILRSGVTPVKLAHLVELRSALAAAYSAAGRSAPAYTDAPPVAGRTPIRATHVLELRSAVAALE